VYFAEMLRGVAGLQAGVDFAAVAQADVAAAQAAAAARAGTDENGGQAQF
jgi:hypothetical protein